MKATIVVGALAVASLATAGAGYAWQLNQEVAALSKRVTALAAELGRVQEASDSPAPLAREVPAFLVQAAAATAAAATAAPVQDAKIREVVRGELERRKEEEQAVIEADEAELAEQLRDSLSTELALDAVTLARLETLGDELAAAEHSLLADREARRITDAEAHTRYVKAWTEDEGKLQRLLGDDRYRKLVALRSEHPEFARAVYVLRTAPPASAPQENQP
jgi:hypothetical protein